jgi:hypothetical protein
MGTENVALPGYKLNEALSKRAMDRFSDFPSITKADLTEKELSAKYSSTEGVPLRSWLGAYNSQPGFTFALKISWYSPLGDLEEPASHEMAVLSWLLPLNNMKLKRINNKPDFLYIGR